MAEIFSNYADGDRVSHKQTGALGTVVEVAPWKTDVEVEWDANEHGGFRKIHRTSEIEFAVEI